MKFTSKNCFNKMLSPGLAGSKTTMSHISLEEPRALVQQLVSKFLPENDSSSIQSVLSNFNQLLTSRQKKMAQSRETLQCKKRTIVQYLNLKN